MVGSGTQCVVGGYVYSLASTDVYTTLLRIRLKKFLETQDASVSAKMALWV